ncbi:hypothetical protein PRUPE_6G256000 [Prunus persica]|uniref:Uncharacterized protein n=1 Tax=Prunus persica TaxID=3760 RepID=A0A251NVU8_PRUPE|nr:hypothetical protein PRUPE_6G256000 [Prunus persica]
MNCIRGLKKVDLLVSNPIKISETPIPRSSMQWYHNTASILLSLGFIGLSLPIVVHGYLIQITLYCSQGCYLTIFYSSK